MDAYERFERLRERPHFQQLSQKIDAGISASIADYSDRVATSGDYADLHSSKSAKALKDSVWGMVGLTPQEVVVLDSPPLQRMRRVRQLGLTYLTYPTASYSRFEHIVGSVHQAERMLRALMLRSPEFSTTLAESRSVVRLAALTHDIGHMPLSHVTENFFTEAECTDAAVLGEIQAVVKEVADVFRVKPKLAEILSLAMIASPSFFTFLTDVARYDKPEIAKAAMSVVGAPPSLSEAFVAQLISNVIDADKLDYMFRDAFVTGLPLAVDLERLLYKLKCLRVPLEVLGGAVFTSMGSAGDHAIVLGTDVNGERLVYDLDISRRMLYERVYLHHKTRAAERIAMDLLRTLSKPPWKLVCEGDEIFAAVGHADAVHSARRLLDRNLPRRAFGFSLSLLDDAPPGWDSLKLTLGRVESRQQLEAEIIETAARFGEILGHKVPNVWVDANLQSPALSGSRFLIERPDGKVDQGSSFPPRAAAYPQSAQQISYVFADGGRRAQELVFIASEVVFAKRFELSFGREAADHAKVDFAAAQELKRELEENEPSVYADLGVLRPTSRFVRLGEAQTRLEGLAARFGGFYGESDVRVSKEHVCRFLDQFPEALVEPMVTVLESVTFLDRKLLGKQFLEYLRDEGGPQSVLVPLTGAIDKSASHIAYFFADSERPQIFSLPEALKTDSDILFFDDVLISGSQAGSIVQVMMGKEPDLDEDVASELSSEQLDALRSRTVRYRFAVGTTEGVARLKQISEESGLGGDVACMQIDAPGVVDSVLEAGDAAALKAFLADVGTALLQSTNAKENPTKWTPEKCQECALGYGDSQRLIVMSHNTPTGTVTALWKTGFFRGQTWQPIFPRRGESESGLFRPAAAPEPPAVDDKGS